MVEVYLTAIESLYIEGKCNHRIIDGVPERVETIRSKEGVAQKISKFSQNKIVAYERWERNQFGTINWEIFVFKTSIPGKMIQSIQGVRPGAELFIYAKGKSKVKELFKVLDELQVKDIKISSLSEGVLRTINNRLHANVSSTNLIEEVSTTTPYINAI